MSKTNASEPWAAGKAFTYRSSVEWQSFLPVQAWAFVSDWLVCTKTSSWNFIHQDAHTALDCWPAKNSYQTSSPFSVCYTQPTCWGSGLLCSWSKLSPSCPSSSLCTSVCLSFFFILFKSLVWFLRHYCGVHHTLPLIFLSLKVLAM